MSNELYQDALEYHKAFPAGKLAITSTKPMVTQRDLALAYSPGVAAACEAIVDSAEMASRFTTRGNLVAVISNGTAVLGLGSIGALASKPVMEGKAVLFKKFSGIDVFDLEIEESNPDKLVEIIASLEPTFGGINLEDIKAPECFAVESALREKMNIPVFHDDQHGTAIVSAAAINSALKIVDKDIRDIKLVVSGAGAAAIACLDLLVSMGLDKTRVLMLDSRGVVYEGREQGMDDHKARYAATTTARTMDDAIVGADIFLGCSGPRSLTGEQVSRMVPDPIILALANPIPEIMPEEAMAANPSAIIATGRSDYPNQVNNVLCFPFIFRGALDVGATTVNEEMKLACVEALTDLAMKNAPKVVKNTYIDETLTFGPGYLIPKPFDPRLIVEVSSAVARAAMESGVASRPVRDFERYRNRLAQYVTPSTGVMYPIIEKARKASTRLCFSEAEDERILEAAQHVVEEGVGYPVLVGSRDVITQKISDLGLALREGQNFELINMADTPDVDKYAEEYARLMARKGVTAARARHLVATRTTILSCMMLHCGDVDAVLCGAMGPFDQRLAAVEETVGREDGVGCFSTLVGLIMDSGMTFICDPHVNADPSADDLAEMAVLAARELRRFGMEPRIACTSHSSFGASRDSSARKMAKVVSILRERSPELAVDGEMAVEAALLPEFRNQIISDSAFEGTANLLIMPNKDSANIACSSMKVAANAAVIGPILLGGRKPIHIVTPASTARSIFNMSALAAAQARMDRAH